MSSENEPDVNDEVSNTREAELENRSVATEAASENSSSTNVISTNSRLGFLSLPGELRLSVYRELLLHDHPLSTEWPGAGYQPFPAILHTCTLIRREAFQVMYGENTFYMDFMHPTHSILKNRQLRDRIQNVEFEANLCDLSSQTKFLHLMREFGSPSIVRGVLNIIFRVGASENDGLHSWFAVSLRKFTNFRIIQIEYVAAFRSSLPGAYDLAQQLCPILCDAHKHSLTPVFGPAISFTCRHGLRFRPQSYLNSLPPDVDWMHHLDGIRLNWNQDPTDVDESEASAQNTDSEA